VQGGPRLLVLLGASGSGKSSLLRAGVLPRLRRAGREWVVLPVLRPQMRPLESLAQTLAVALQRPEAWRELHHQLLTTTDPPALAGLFAGWAADLRLAAASPEAQLLLPIDQAEELFTVAEAAERQRFVAVLAAALQPPLPLQVVMTIRADAMGSLQSLPELVNILETLPLGPLSLERYREIIEGPARVAGLKAEPAFVERAIHDTATEDALPLLAFALRQLHDQYGADGVLSLSDYQALGDPAAKLSPLENAVKQAADGVLQAQRPDEASLKALREAFVPAMVRVSEQGSYARRAAIWESLPEAARPLLEALVAARLLVRRQGEGQPSTVEVTHEALLRVWPLLSSWLDDSRDFLLGSQQLEQDLAQWQAASPADQPQALLSGLKLAKGRAWLAERGVQLRPDLRNFIQASQRRAAGQRRLRIGYIAAAFAVISGAGAYALVQLQRARAAQTAQFEATHRALVASDPFLSVVHGLAAMAGLRNSTAQQIILTNTLEKAIQNNYERNKISTDQAKIDAIVLLPSGELVTAGDEGFLKWWDKDGKFIRSVDSQQFKISSLILLKSGELASAGDDGNIKRWSQDGRLLNTSERYSRTKIPMFSLAELTNGELASGSWDGSIRIWGSDGKLLQEIQGNQGLDPIYSLLSLKNGELISGTQSGTINHWSRDGKLVKSRNSGQGEIHALAVLADGEVISAGPGYSRSRGNLIKRWDADFNLITSFESEQEGVRAIAISSDNKLLTGGEDGSIRCWDLNGRIISAFATGQGSINTIISLPKQRVMSGGKKDGIIKFWDLKPTVISNTIPIGLHIVRALAISPIGDMMAGGDNGEIHHLSRYGKLVNRIKISNGQLSSLLMLPDQSLIVSVRESVEHFDRDGGLINNIRIGQQRAANALGKRNDDEIVSAGEDDSEFALGPFAREPGSIVHTRLDGRLVSTIKTGPGPLTALAVLPKGEMAVGNGGLIQFWSKDGKLLKRINTGADNVNSIVVLPTGEIACAESQSITSGQSARDNSHERDSVISLWKNNGVLIGKIPVNPGILYALATDSSGNLFGAGTGPEIRKWSSKDIVRIGCLQLQQHLALRYPQSAPIYAARDTCIRAGVQVR